MKTLDRLAIAAVLGMAQLAPGGFTQTRTRTTTFTTLYSFTGQNGDGALPYAGLIVGKHARLYGTTAYGGTWSAGTVFELQAPGAGGGAWTETVLYSFAGGSDGANPYGGLVFGANGALYGTTSAGGTANAGTVFELAPPTVDGGAWKETILHDFGAIGDGADPRDRLVFDSSGVLYGTTFYGGQPQPSPNCVSGCGTVFGLTPPTGAGGAWTETALYTFPEGNFFGGNPAAGVVIGAGGILRGTTVYGGATGLGTVFELTPPGAPGGVWTETVLHSFNSAAGDGGFPYGGLVVGKSGAIYGTTYAGGSAPNDGTVFQLDPPSWTESVYTFTFADGVNPYGGLVIGANGALFGTTFTGGTVNPTCATNGCGTVFELTPPTAPGGTWVETLLHKFSGENGDGAEPYAGLVLGAKGEFYGTTAGGGTYGWGTVFAVTP